MTEKTLTDHIDHTILKADTRIKEVERVCNEAKKANLYAVCVPPYFVNDTKRFLEGSKVKIVTVIGFPMGYAATPSKAAEIHRAIDEGADELDVVVNVCAIKSNNWNYVRNDIKTMTVAAQMKGKLVSIIFEISLLTQKEIKELCKICAEEGVNFVKTSSGFHGDSTSEEMVQSLRKKLPQEIKIKTSGGIKNAKKAIALLNAGADRIGSSIGLKFIS